MSNDRAQGQAFQELLVEYFPRDAVQVQEDVRVAQQQSVHTRDTEANLLLASLGFGPGRQR